MDRRWRAGTTPLTGDSINTFNGTMSPDSGSINDPLSTPPSYHPPQRSSTSVLTVLAVIGCGLLAICGGGLALMYVAVSRIANGGPEAVAVPESREFVEDEARFNASLKRIALPQSDDSRENQSTARDFSSAEQSFYDWLVETIESSESEEDVPFDRIGFIAAIDKSRFDAQLDLFDKLALRRDLQLYYPAPELEEQFNILDVRIAGDGQTAEADLIFYADYSDAYSYQWFCSKTETGWNVYDWQRMEYGRRMSDEWAGYMRYQEQSRAMGYDDAMGLVGEAIDVMEEDEEEAARLIARAESTRMLDTDWPVAALRIAWGYQHLGRDDEAIRVLEKLPEHQRTWGVWYSLSMSYANQDQPDLALAAAKQFEKRSPHHPELHYLMAVLLEAKDTGEDSATRIDRMMQRARVMPLDVFARDELLENAPEELKSELLDLLTRSRAPAEIWVGLIFEAWWDPTLTETLLRSADQVDQRVSGFKRLLEGLQHVHVGEYAVAANQFHQVIDTTDSAAIKDQATELYRRAQIDAGQFADWLRKATDVQEELQYLAQSVFEDEFEGDADKLRIAILDLPPDWQESLWAQALLGWSTVESADTTIAMEHYRRVIDHPDVARIYGKHRQPTEFYDLDDPAVLITDWCQGQYIAMRAVDGDERDLFTAWSKNAQTVYQLTDAVCSSPDPARLLAFRSQLQSVIQSESNGNDESPVHPIVPLVKRMDAEAQWNDGKARLACETMLKSIRMIGSTTTDAWAPPGW
ncbi:MAG: tetratricopeptide repeat protein, partial [Planctomycetota bacterium]